MGRGEISKVESRPRFGDHGLIALKGTQLLSLLLVKGRRLEIASISVIHSRHVIGVGAAWTEGDSLLSGSHRLIMPTLKIANIANDEVGLAVAGVGRESTIGAVQCCVKGCRPVLFPTKSGLVGQGKT